MEDVGPDNPVLLSGSAAGLDRMCVIYRALREEGAHMHTCNALQLQLHCDRLAMLACGKLQTPVQGRTV